MLGMMEMSSGTSMLYERRLFVIRWTRKVMLYFMQLMDVLDASKRTQIYVGHFAVRRTTCVSHEIHMHSAHTHTHDIDSLAAQTYQMEITLKQSLKKIFEFLLVQGPFYKSMETDFAPKHLPGAVGSVRSLLSENKEFPYFHIHNESSTLEWDNFMRLYLPDTRLAVSSIFTNLHLA